MRCCMILLLVAWAAVGRASPAGTGHTSRCPHVPHSHRAVTVRGSVLDPQGKPAAGAQVWVGYFTGGRSRRPLAEGRADRLGRFSLPCSVILYASGTRYDYGNLDVLAAVPGKGIDLRHFDVRHPSTVGVVLQPVAAAAGEVRGCDGKPVAGAQVRLWGVDGIPRAPFATWTLGTAAATHSDAKGRFRIPLLPARGFGRLRVQAKGMQEASAIVRAGTPAVVTLHYEGTLAGRLVASDRKTPLAGATVRLVDEQSSCLNARETRAGADGRFSFAGLHSTYAVSTPDLPVVPFRVGVTWCQQASLSDIVVPAGGTVSGKVTDGGRPIAGGVSATPAGRLRDPGVRVASRWRCASPSRGKLPDGPLHYADGPAARRAFFALTAADGSFSIRLPAGEWELVAARVRRVGRRTAVFSPGPALRLRVANGQRATAAPAVGPARLLHQAGHAGF